MAKVTGLGGVFFKSNDPKGLTNWYRDNLGIQPMTDTVATFSWRDLEDPERVGMCVWSPFPADTEYFQPSDARFMINYRVDDLDGMLAQLRAAGVTVDPKVEDTEYGRFGWAMDPDGNRIELWEPPDSERS